jgi:DNA-binding transcriptional regulator YiaG
MSTAKDVTAAISLLDMASREAFGEMMDEVSKVLSEEDLVTVLETTRITIQRWTQKRNTPSPLFRKVVQKVLIEHLKQMQA